MTIEIQGNPPYEQVRVVNAYAYGKLEFVMQLAERTEPVNASILAEINLNCTPAFSIGRGRYVLLRNEDILAKVITNAIIQLVLSHGRRVATCWLAEILFKEQLESEVPKENVLAIAKLIYNAPAPISDEVFTQVQEFSESVVKASRLKRERWFNRVWSW